MSYKSFPPNRSSDLAFSAAKLSSGCDDLTQESFPQVRRAV
jgi:hypothetical protein